jgi:formylglycine-generating enzyme required for sulfatase activity/uncharacterized caspase-like protein
MKLLIILLAVWLGIASAAEPQRNLGIAPASGEKRVALVIGNAAYPGVAGLKNPANDARDIAAKLKKLGFDVTVRTDVRYREMLRSLTEFGDKVQTGTEALFFYAGHGMQVRGKNYLIPIDAEIRNEGSVSSEAVDVDQLLDKLSPARLSVVILDACRNNPFERRFRGNGQGLAQINAPTGTLIAYATAPGKVAADGDGRNGLYTSELLSAMDVPGIKIEDVFKRVRTNVVKKSGDAQTPWESSSLTGDFYFAVGMGIQSGLASHTTKGTPEDEAWEAAEGANSSAGYEAYLTEYPKGRHAATARVKLATSRVKTKPMDSLAMEAPPKSDLAKPIGGTIFTPGQTFKDCDVCPDMVEIPAGSFEMGSPSYEEGRHEFEGPIRRIRVDKFAIGRTEITRGQFAAFVAETAYRAGTDCNTFENGKAEKRTGRDWRNPGFAQEDSHPVVCVNRSDAEAYLLWLSRKSGKRYRLPSEAEWEYSARAGSLASRFWGDDPSQACQYANVQDLHWQDANIHRCDDGYTFTAPVASYQPNAFGLYDMIGNVWESVQDYYGHYSQAPTDGSARSDRTNEGAILVGGGYVLRGCSWVCGTDRARSSVRGREDDYRVRTSYQGFRAARWMD